MPARIFRPAKTAVSSGRRKTHEWVLEMEPAERGEPDPLTGWIGSGDTRQQLTLKFDTQEAAETFAKKKGIAYRLELPHERTIKPKSYSENFIRRT